MTVTLELKPDLYLNSSAASSSLLCPRWSATSLKMLFNVPTR